MGHLFRNVAPLVALTASTLSGCEGLYKTVPWDAETDSAFPKDIHPLTPPTWPSEGQIATGAVGSEVLEQPIAFSHYRHTTVLGMDCQYCHTEARRSIHAGMPPVETCMGCHSQVLTESVEIKKIAAAWEAGETIAWQKVHDLPDYVSFNHARHVQGGVDCTECHGLIPLQGKPYGADINDIEVMKREASLQMGWCLDCHRTHPNIDETYGDNADLRRSELKDCWTCHK